MFPHRVRGVSKWFDEDQTDVNRMSWPSQSDLKLTCSMEDVGPMCLHHVIKTPNEVGRMVVHLSSKVQRYFPLCCLFFSFNLCYICMIHAFFCFM